MQSKSLPLLPTLALLSLVPALVPVPVPASISPGQAPTAPCPHSEMLLFSRLLLGGKSANNCRTTSSPVSGEAALAKMEALDQFGWGKGLWGGRKGEVRPFPFPQVPETLSCLSASVCLQSVRNHVGLSFLLGRIGSPRSSWSPWTHCKYKNKWRSGFSGL